MKIIAGMHRGRPLKTLGGEATRPSSGRVREAMFNIIGPWIGGQRVLDLYAGSGALGIEALSRGAAAAVLVEQAAPAIAVIRDNLKTLKLEAEVLPSAVITALPRLTGTFGLVFADPPYDLAADELPQVLAKLDERGLVARGGLVMLEHRRGTPLPEAVGGLVLRRRYPYSDTEVSVFELP